MKQISRKARTRFIFAAAVLLSLIVSSAAWANDSAEAFMSVTFGLSSARTQKRMENSGAVALDYIRSGRISMKGTFDYRPAIFTFGFHSKRGLNHKSAYLASSGDAAKDGALYGALRDAYNARFGETDERLAQNRRVKGRVTLQSSWKPNKDTTISLSYNPEVTIRFPGDSPSDHPIHLSYNYTKWTK